MPTYYTIIHQSEMPINGKPWAANEMRQGDGVEKVPGKLPNPKIGANSNNFVKEESKLIS